VESTIPVHATVSNPRKNYIIDIDGVICENVLNEEPDKMADAREMPGARRTINRWFDQGHFICFLTARTDEQEAITEKWLRKHGFKYHLVLYSKPRGGNYHYVDDKIIRATRFKGKFGRFVLRRRTIEVFE
jgi:hypothetical protein